MAIKNQSIIIQFTAWDTANNAGKTGDSANFTLKLIQDGTAATPTNSPSEVDATNCPGVYKITLTNDEMNYSTVTLAGKSSSTGIVIIPVHIVTEQGNLATIAGYIDSVESTGVVLAATQGNYAPAKAGDKMDIVDAPSTTGTGAIVSAIWNKLLTGITTSDSIGKLIKDYLDAAISTRSTYAGGAVASVTAAVTVGANNDKTGYTATVSDKTGFSLSADGITAIWHQLLSAITTADSIGKLLKDNINATIGSRSSHSAADVWASATRALTDKSGFSGSGTVTDKTGFSLAVTPPTASDIAAAVWGAVSRTITDKTGFSLSTVGILAIWHQLVSEIVTASTIGKLIKDNLDAKVSEVGGGAAPTVEQIRAEMDSNSTKLANLDMAISAIPTAAEINAELGREHGAGAWDGSTLGTHSYSDTIVDSLSNPISGAQVYAYTDSDYQTLATSGETDANGNYTLYFAAAGTYYLRAVADGKVTGEKSVVVT